MGNLVSLLRFVDVDGNQVGMPMTNDIKHQMDTIYGSFALDKIPWNLVDPPQYLVELVESKRILPCEAVDLGCGAGNYAVWFASRGFQMTGIDISRKAIELAEELSRKRGVECCFMAKDLQGDLESLHCSFDFAYDWEVLHHVFPEDRGKYVRNVHRVLRDGSKYLSVCFSEEDAGFGGTGKYRRTPLGTTLYFSSEEEMQNLFEPLFHIQELCTSEITGKYGPHRAIIALMTR